MKRIVVYVVTYNQEDVIRRCLDSILVQKEWGLYKIVVSDDCSTDHTWVILNDYKKNFDSLFDIYRNEHNLGIYGNTKKVISYLPESDFYCDLAGDDEFCEGYFESVQKIIEDKSINPNEEVGIFSNWETILLDGQNIVHDQSAVISDNSLWSLKARGLVSSRSLMISKRVINLCEPILEGRGLNLTEAHHDSQPHLIIKKPYFIPVVTSKYYAGIGVSKRLCNPMSTYNTTENIEKWNYAITNYIKNDRDMHYAKYQIMRSYYYMKPKWMNLIVLYYHYLKGQLPGYQDSINVSLHLLFFLIKYKLFFKKQN